MEAGGFFRDLGVCNGPYPPIAEHGLVGDLQTAALVSAFWFRREATTPSGWDARLYWQCIACNTIAFVIVLTVGFDLALLGDEALHLDLASHHVLVALLIATLGGHTVRGRSGSAAMAG